MQDDLAKCLFHQAISIREAMAAMDRHGLGIVLVVDDAGKLLRTLTDGDFRRLVLSGTNLDQSLSTLVFPDRRKPLTAAPGTNEKDLLHLMNQNSLRHIPLVDGDGRVVDIALLKNLARDYELSLKAVVMAGGFGKRLQPLTDDIPKPMLKIGERPVLEHIIRQLSDSGIRQVKITTHYKPEKITDHFGDGRDFNVNLEYVTEEQPLGTAGSLGLIEPPTEPVLVMNGDILTRVDFQSMFHFHQDHHADMTVAVRQYEMDIPFGVVETSGERVTGIREKPLMKFFVNAGIYLLEPSVFRFIPREGTRFDMPELIERLLAAGRNVVSFPVSEYWLDIGQHDDYQRAQEDHARKPAPKETLP